MVPPGHRLTVDLEGERAGAPAICRYWDPLAAADRRREAQASNDCRAPLRGLRERLESAVEQRMVADVPLGAFLSGGVDSSTVVGLMSEASAAPVRTFTVVFNDAGYDDAPYARLAAQRFGTDHQEIRLSDDDLVERVPAAVAAQDHPSADGINTWIVSQAAKQAGLTVSLSGLGGDELFGGYPSFRRLTVLRKVRQLMHLLPRPARNALGIPLQAVRISVALEKIAELLRTDGSVPEAYPVLRRLFGPHQADELLAFGTTRRPEHECPYSDHLYRAFDEHPCTPLLARVTYAEMTCYMQDVLLRDTDQMSMAHSLEVRVPFLDKELVEYALALPEDARRPSSPPKRYLVEAVKDLLPEPVAYRPKSGFAMPFDRWMREPLRAFCEQGLEAVAAHPGFRGEAVWEVWRKFLAGNRRLPWSRPWLLVALGHWLERESVR